MCVSVPVCAFAAVSVTCPSGFVVSSAELNLVLRRCRLRSTCRGGKVSRWRRCAAAEPSSTPCRADSHSVQGTYSWVCCHSVQGMYCWVCSHSVQGRYSWVCSHSVQGTYSWVCSHSVQGRYSWVCSHSVQGTYSWVCSHSVQGTYSWVCSHSIQGRYSWVCSHSVQGTYCWVRSHKSPILRGPQAPSPFLDLLPHPLQ